MTDINKNPELKTKKISIIIPVYNSEKYLTDCLESCIVQSLHDIECIVVNDGSRDNSQQIIDSYVSKDSRFISVLQENHGAGSARNNGLKNASGEVIMFMDSDDYLSPNACETVWKEYQSNNPDIIIFKTNIIAETDTEIPEWLKDTLTNIQQKTYNSFTSQILFNEPAAKPFVWRDAFRRSFISENKLSFSEIKLTEDLVFLMESFPHGNRFSFITEALYNYRWGRIGSVMDETSDLEIRMPLHFSAVDHISSYWKKQNWLILYGEEYIIWMFNFLLLDIFREKISIGAQHLKSLSKIVSDYNLDSILEQISPVFYKAYTSISETVTNQDINQETILEHLSYQIKTIILQMQNEQKERRIIQLSKDNNWLLGQLDQKNNSILMYQLALDSVYNSASWKIGNLLIQPLHWAKKIIKK